MSLEAATEGGTDGLAVGLAFTFEFCETCISRVATDLSQRWVLEVVLPVVDVRDRHCLVEGPLVVQTDNSVISVTMVKLLSLR